MTEREREKGLISFDSEVEEKPNAVWEKTETQRRRNTKMRRRGKEKKKRLYHNYI